MLHQDTIDQRPVEAAGAAARIEDRRGAKRLRTLKQARIVTSNWTSIDCLIRDISDHGARIALGGLADLPAEFRLYIVSSHTLIPAELEWRRSLLAGLRFTGPAEPAPARIF